MKLIVISLLLVSFGVYVQTRSVSVFGDIPVEYTDDKWICDMIECPLNSERCFVSNSNEEDPSVLKRTNICYSKDNTILAHKTETSAINPNYQVRQQLNAHRNGGVSFSDANTNNGIFFNGNGFAQNLGGAPFQFQSDMEKMQSEIAEQQSALAESLRRMQNNLFNTFN